MKRKLLIIISSLFLAVSTYTVSNAMSVNIGVTGSLATIDAEGSETSTVDTGAEASTRSASVQNASVPVGSVFVEFQSDFYGLTVGAEHVPGSADVSDSIKRRTDAETSVSGTNTAVSNSRDFKANAEIENFNKVYIELPIMDKFFVRAGMAEIDVNTTEVASGNGGSYGNTSLDGEVLGAGIKGTAGNMGWKVFYEQTNFDTLKLTSTGNSADSGTNSITADLDVSEVKFALSYNF
tara:strand:+ start:1432 stop:2142 length:711 start_codon:yes stop_codon:yes gene_type:complete